MHAPLLMMIALLLSSGWCPAVRADCTRLPSNTRADTPLSTITLRDAPGNALCPGLRYLLDVAFPQAREFVLKASKGQWRSYNPDSPVTRSLCPDTLSSRVGGPVAAFTAVLDIGCLVPPGPLTITLASTAPSAAAFSTRNVSLAVSSLAKAACPGSTCPWLPNITYTPAGAPLNITALRDGLLQLLASGGGGTTSRGTAQRAATNTSATAAVLALQQLLVAASPKLTVAGAGSTRVDGSREDGAHREDVVLDASTLLSLPGVSRDVLVQFIAETLALPAALRDDGLRFVATLARLPRFFAALQSGMPLYSDADGGALGVLHGW